jgi:hypothetical protein
MTPAQVRGIIGPPEEIRPVLRDSAIWVWREGRQTAVVIFCTYEEGSVVGKHFIDGLD